VDIVILQNYNLLVDIVTTVIEILNIMFFNMAAILDLVVKMNPKCIKNCCNRFGMLEIIQNDTLFDDIVIIVLEILGFIYFKMASAAILKSEIYTIPFQQQNASS